MPKKTETTAKITVKKIKKPEFYQAVGGRKSATARVRLYPVVKNKIKIGDFELGAGDMVVNNRKINQYFPGSIQEKLYLEPFILTNNLNRFAVSVKVKGSGLLSQIGAVAHGISRALLIIDKEQYRLPLKKAGLLTRDPRMKERRKAGLAGKARAGKQSPKR